VDLRRVEDLLTDTKKKGKVSKGAPGLNNVSGLTSTSGYRAPASEEHDGTKTDSLPVKKSLQAHENESVKEVTSWEFYLMGE